mmetsp:Transcript_7188/g.9097  ORF Transcript_7188/g.9097 Transcript_7188/m.9097 type:complete len:343 (+) Transcript_7188:240-1268(+)
MMKVGNREKGEDGKSVSNNAKRSIVVFCGLPGSGKSSFAQLIRKALPTTLSVVNVEFDLFERRLKKSGTGRPQGSAWSEIDAKIWKQARCEALAEVERQLQGENDTVVLLDDNMYYRSMRSEVKKMARRLGTGFVQIYMCAGVKDSMRMNASRDSLNQVPEAVIIKMAEMMEPPDSKFDKPYTICIGPPPLYSVMNSENLSVAIRESSVNYNNAIEAFKKLLNISFNNPLDETNKEIQMEKLRLADASREQGRKNALHQVELEMKRQVGKYISSQSPSARKEAALHAAAVKKQFGESIKEKIKDFVSHSGGDLTNNSEDQINMIKSVVLDGFLPLLYQTNGS